MFIFDLQLNFNIFKRKKKKYINGTVTKMYTLKLTKNSNRFSLIQSSFREKPTNQFNLKSLIFIYSNSI